jgi:transcription termination factor Rho
MNKAELEKKPLSDLHLLAAEAGVPKYRMLSKSELVERLAGGNGGDAAEAPPKRDAAKRPEKNERSEKSERPERQRRRRREPREGAERRDRSEKAPEREPTREPERPAEPEPASQPAAPTPSAAAPPRPRRRRRRRFGRRGKQGVTLQGLLLPPEAGRQALVFAETREGCTALLRGVAADLAADSKGPDPVALLIDPSPEELADWKRDAPQAEIVSAGQPRHASDALAQAASRAAAGDDVILLVDSLTRLGEAYEDAEAAKEFFDAGRAQGTAGGGSLTVVAALERSESA